MERLRLAAAPELSVELVWGSARSGGERKDALQETVVQLADDQPGVIEVRLSEAEPRQSIGIRFAWRQICAGSSSQKRADVVSRIAPCEPRSKR